MIFPDPSLWSTQSPSSGLYCFTIWHFSFTAQRVCDADHWCLLSRWKCHTDLRQRKNLHVHISAPSLTSVHVVLTFINLQVWSVRPGFWTASVLSRWTKSTRWWCHTAACEERWRSRWWCCWTANRSKPKIILLPRRLWSSSSPSCFR